MTMGRAVDPRSPRRQIGRGSKLGRYEVEKVLSAPGEPCVVQARRPDDAPAVLTLLDETLTGHRLRSTVRLVRARAALEHPGLVPLRGPFRHADRAFYATAGLPGATLADRLEDGPLELEEAVRLVREVAAVLELGAAAGLIHRDLTPAEVRLAGGSDARARLTDFGLARRPARACEQPAELRAVAYRSPEELCGEPPRRRSNVYSLACILAECLTGSPPFRYDRPLLTIHAHAVAPRPRLADRRPGLPVALDDVLARALAADPRERHCSPAEFAAEVARAAGLVAPVPTAERRHERRSRETAGARHERRSRQTAGTRRQRGRRRPLAAWPARVSAAWVGLALAASAASGFATGNVAVTGSGPGPAASPAPLDAGAAQPPARSPGAAALSGVSRAVARLDARRTQTRRVLRRARRTPAQAAAAKRLALAFRDARAAMPTGARRTPAGQSLSRSLDRAGHAYGDLATAARRGDERRWAAARRAALRGERQVDAALEALPRPRTG